MIQIRECPVCRSKSFDPFFEVTDYVVSGDSFSIVECGSCHVRLTRPVPDEKEIRSYYDTDDYFHRIKTALENDGVLIVAVPNFYSYDAEYNQSRWAAYDAPRHLYHFTWESMTDLLKRYGLTITAIKRLPFDAFYVSILSEKHQEGSTARGMWI